MSAVAIALPRRTPPDPRQLQRCLLLAALLHVWLVLMFGNATGSASPGQGVWGSLTVKLLGRSGGEPGAPPGDPAKEFRDNGAPGQGPQQRQGGQVRPTEAAAAKETGAAALGRWNPQEVTPEAARTEEVSPAPPSAATLNLPEGFRPVEREDVAPPRRLAPAESTVVPLRPTDIARPTPAAPLRTLAPELPAAIGRLETRPDTTVAPLPSANLRTPTRAAELPPLPTELPTPVQRLEAAPTTGPTPALPRPSELRLAPAPAAAAAPSIELPPPVRRLEAPAESGVAAPLPRPAELRSTAPSTVAQPAPSAALPPAVQRLEAPTTEGVSAAPLTRANELRAPAATSAPATLPSAQDLPAALRRLESADAGSGTVVPLQPAQNLRASPSTPGASALPELSRELPGAVAAPTGPAQGDPNANPYAAPKASAGSPDAGSRLGPDLAVPPSAAASAPRAPLNLSLPRSGDIAARRGPGLIDVMPQPPERKSKLEQSIEDAANKDCRKAYANAGILAAIPLAIDTARGKGCKW